MTGLDRRHKWDGGRKVAMESRIVHTCLACGRTQSFELIIPDSFIDALVAIATKPNPYRLLFAKGGVA